MKLGLLTLLAAAAWTGSAGAGTIVDQQYTETPNVGFSIDFPSFNPIGQSFTPTLAALDFVELRLADFSGASGLGATFLVRIREGGAGTGAILGTSAEVALANGFGTFADDFGLGFAFGGSELRFDFAAPVALAPGTLHTIELVKVSGDTFQLFGRQPGGYAGGTGVTGGIAASTDFFFREGISGGGAVVPEPGSIALLGLGLSSLTGYSWRRSRAPHIAA